jgi:hypothetical protein
VAKQFGIWSNEEEDFQGLMKYSVCCSYFPVDPKTGWFQLRNPSHKDKGHECIAEFRGKHAERNARNYVLGLNGKTHSVTRRSQ